MLRTVLLVEDNPALSFCIINDLTDEGVQVLSAKKIYEATDLFEKNKDLIDLIIMDACLEDTAPDTILLVEEIVRYGFAKPIIANSSDNDYSALLRRAGATHTANKEDVTNLALKLLGIP